MPDGPENQQQRMSNKRRPSRVFYRADTPGSAHRPASDNGSDWDDWHDICSCNEPPVRLEPAQLTLQLLPAVQQLGLVLAFVGAFAHVVGGRWSPEALTGLAAAAVVPAAGLWLVRHEPTWRSGAARALQALWTCSLIAVLLIGLAPVFRTLTSEISSDTLYMLVLFLFSAHVLFRASPLPSAQALITSGSIQNAVPLNAAVFASVLLASRLDDSSQVFALMACSLGVFAVGPMMLSNLVNALVTAAISLASFAFVRDAFPHAAPLHLLLHAIFLAGVPSVYYMLQPYKAVIRGPWDEAELEDLGDC